VKRPPRRKQLVFKTPERECAHADRGCCPPCLNPMRHMGTLFHTVKLTKRPTK
jgi:hypothetical protein